ncbi:hypothetical protein EK21DRAFT_110534 [Setomelanomma holmii]|uniref:Uncharacterized protein n=1 Tax=Setomelanomma holmii TaxID=210430 RepID=A0A9P4HC08_9PLEO|nr:hypothetical protein EK21DRAFT_110534 [Setomelanomma holmii]
MPPTSPIILEVDEFDEPNVRRARSNGQFDYLKEQGRWRRRDQELQMTRYRDRGYYGASYQRPRADHLTIPVYATSPRRPRARSDTRDEASRNFRTQEIRSSPQAVVGATSSSEPLLSRTDSELERHTRGSNHSKTPAYKRPNPKIKVPPVIIQDDPPVSSDKSPSASPRSPSGQPQLQDKYLLLQNQLAEITSSCLRYINVEAANPDLRFDGQDKVDDDEAIFEDTPETRTEREPIESLGYIIDSSLHSIRLQIKGLKRLTRALQDATPDAKQEFTAVSARVDDVVRFFGSEGATRRYPVDSKFVGRRALEEVKVAAGY